MIQGLQDVYVNVHDMKRAIVFYRDVLGLRLIDSSDWWSAFDLGGVRLGLHWSEAGPVPHVPRDAHGAHGGATITLKVASIDDAAAHLTHAGVRLLGPIQHAPWGSLVAFEDPDGNVLKLMQPTR